MFQFRDRVIVSTDQGKIEGYVYHIVSPKELYVILTGQNTRPVLVTSKQVELYVDPSLVKRKRGRPRKEKKC